MKKKVFALLTLFLLILFSCEKTKKINPDPILTKVTKLLKVFQFVYWLTRNQIKMKIKTIFKINMVIIALQVLPLIISLFSPEFK